MRNPIIAALDVSNAERALELATALAPVVGAVKIGSELFTSAGPDIVRGLRATGAAVFLDLKFHDIPNTVAKSVAAAARLDVQMLTVHTSGGLAMLEAAERAVRETVGAERGSSPPLVLGVTVLTSLDNGAIREVGFAAGVEEQVARLAELAVRAGLRGLVCSPQELPVLRRRLRPEIQLVTPGIRPTGAAPDDQKRALTPREAIAAGADWLVIGRPLYGASDPRAAAEAILGTLER
ncbi:MAG: orotidine-5'-phosphate decarboxylase [Verrucomicrobia bacterium]|nr:orotidine-5'-phosphate decarboxylase [Verrucomicrobiota bacterium]